MKVLMVNKFFYIKGGSETYYFSLKELLEKNGHEVIDFSMKDEKNFDSKYSKYFVDAVDYNRKQSIFSKIKSGLKIIYSYEAKKKLEKLIIETKPDIAHLHIFQHQISLSILDVLKKYNIPVVYTAHDLKMLCPNYKMLDNDLNICEKCKGGKYFNCLKNKCLKKSVIKSFIGTTEAYLNKWRKSYEKIDYIITPSKFYKDKFIEFGVEKNKIQHITNFLNAQSIDYEKLSNQNYYLYFGRLSEEKGIMTLINAAEETNINLKIVGTGPLKEEIEQYVQTKGLDSIEILGYKYGKDLYTIVGNAKCVILPSEWYENGPYSAIETLKLSRPLIGSDLAGIPELIENNLNGFIFEHSNKNSLIEKINKFESLSDLQIAEMQKVSHHIFENNYLDDMHYNKIINIYNMLTRNRT